MRPKILFSVLTGIVLLAACKQKTNYEADKSRSSAADTIGMADTTATKLVKTADINFKVKNVQQTGENISALTAGYNGMVMHHREGSVIERSQDIHISDDSVMRVSSISATAEMTVKIPSEKLDEFMNKVAHMGLYVNNRQMDIADKSLDYLANRLKLKNRQELVNQQKAGKVIIKDPSAVLNLKDDLVDEQIGNKSIDDKVKNSVVSLSFYQSNVIAKEVIANDDPSAYNLPFFKRLGLALANGWSIFMELILALANLWVFIAAGGLVWYLIIILYKPKKGIVTLPPPPFPPVVK